LVVGCGCQGKSQAELGRAVGKFLKGKRRDGRDLAKSVKQRSYT
jgi:hypothetical protein